jgi:hypothetical protein
MSRETYTVTAPVKTRSSLVVNKRQTSAALNNIGSVDQCSTIAPRSKELKNAVNGSLVGAVIGLANGVATLMVIGAGFIPGVFGASLILGYSTFGGMMFGALIGSTGLFAKQ